MNKYLEKVARRKIPTEEDVKKIYGTVSNVNQIHAALTGPKRRKPSHVKKAAAGTDFVKLNTPLFIRALEHAREDIKSDEDLHRFVERVLEAQKNKDETLGMEVYDKIK